MSSSAQRHRRQRSSVTIKKRISVSKLSNGGGPDDGNVDDVPDNALSSAPCTSNDISRSPSLTTPSVSTSGRAEGRHSREPSFNPAHGEHVSPAEADEDRLDDGHALSSGSQDYFNMGYRDSDQLQQAVREEDITSPIHESEPPVMVGDTTTRSELDLFDDDESSFEGVLITEAEAQLPIDDAPVATDAPRKQPSESGALALEVNSNDAPQQDHVPAASSSSSDRSSVPKTPKLAELEGWGNKAASDSSDKRPVRHMSLLTGVGAIANGPESPRLSPRALRSATVMSPSISAGSTTPRSARKASRMSLGYHTASADPRAGTFASRQNLTPPVTGNPFSSFGRPLLDAASRSASVSTAASNDEHASVSTKGGEDVDTPVSQHRGLLERIAEKERTILEIREVLAREELELKTLQQKWQSSMARELSIANHSTLSATPTAAPRDHAKPSADSAGATDAIKGLSAKLGFGSQFNAFLDNLVAVSPGEEQERDLKRVAPAAAGLSALTEEEEGDLSRSQGERLPAVPAKSTSTQADQKRAVRTTAEAKHGSMFGASLAAFSKQMEHQFGATMTTPTSKSPGGDARRDDAENGQPPAPPAKPPAPPAPAEFGWGSLQKRLKEARDNATGFLAMAEAKIGQAMTIDDFVRLDGPESDAKGQSRTDRSSASMQSKAFTEENDREKAALAELSWLNSLAGVKTSGTVDRVVAVKESPRLDRAAARLNQQNLRELDGAGLRPRPSSPTSSSHSTMRPDAASPSLGRSQALSPTLDGRRPSAATSQSAKRNSTTGGGFFETLSAVLGPDKASTASASSPTKLKDKRLSSGGGQSKTRLAARTALNQADGRQTKATSVSPQGGTASSSPGQAIDKAWQWDEPTEEESAQQSGMHVRPGYGIGLYDVDMPVMEPSRPATQGDASAIS